MTYVICEPCLGVKDTACSDACPVDCIAGRGIDTPQSFIDPKRCIDCGLCVGACPVRAILPQAEVPLIWKLYIIKNALHFGEAPDRS